MTLIPHRFRARLALLFGGMALLIGLPTTLFITQIYNDRLIADRGEALHDLAAAVAAVVSENLRERLREIELLARSPLFQHADLDSPDLRARLEEVQTSYRLYSWIGLADPAGQVRAATGGLLLGTDVSQRSWFQGGIKGPFIGDLHEALLLGKVLSRPAGEGSIRFIDFTTPVRDQQGALRGVLGAHAHWDWARAVIQVLTPRQASGVEIFLVNRNGHIIYPEAAAPAEIPPGLTPDQPFLALPWGAATPYLSVLTSVPEVLPAQPLGWRIAVRQPQAAALAEVDALCARMVLLALAAVLVFAALAWWSAWRFAQPLGQLVAVARRIEAGEEDLAPALHTGATEFHDLAEALRTMAATLIRRREALASLNAGLEAEIARRTAELRDSEARARAFMNTASDGVVVIDNDSRILEFNPAAETLFGYRAAEIIGQPLARLMPPQVGTHHGHYVQSSTDQGVRLMGGNRQVEGRTQDGRDFPVAISIGTLGDGAGRLHVGIIRDITQQVRQEAALREAKEAAEAAARAKSEFLSHMSHEIRTPMNAVLGLTQLLNRERLTPNQHDMIQRIQGAGQSLLAIINDILDFSKIEAGQLRLEARPFRLETLIVKLDSLLGATARAKGYDLRIVLPDTPIGPLLGDALRLEQVLINLTGNAIKFTEQGEVAILIQALSLSDTEVRLRFAVRDTGIGISPEAQATLFDPFTQADTGITRRFGGTGLGLSICKRLVELMGGEIGVNSQPGQGSTFWFDLPFARADEAEEASLAAPVAVPTGPRLRGLRILAVDDSAMNRDLVERALKLEGAEVTLAADGQQAVQYLQTPDQPFDAVLMDVQMPVMDGLAAMRHIRRELGLVDLPLLALTAGVLPEEQQAARDAGANEVLAKPLDLDLLATRLAGYTGTDGRTADSGDDRAVAPVVSGDFPHIAGIDRVRAALSVDWDRDFFLFLLSQFITDVATVVEEIRQALGRGDREAAERRLHSLRGSAGSIGALEIMNTATGLEYAIREGLTDLDANLADLDRQLTSLNEASRPWLWAAAVSAQPLSAKLDASPESGPLTTERIEALREALRRHSLDALDLLEDLESALVAAHGEDQIALLAGAIGSLRFEAALDLLQALPPADTIEG